MAEEQKETLVEMKTLSVPLEDIEAIMTDITLRLGQIKQPRLETEARDIRDRVKSLSGHLYTTTIDPNRYHPSQRAPFRGGGGVRGFGWGVF